jgi:hypothetical protein
MGQSWPLGRVPQCAFSGRRSSVVRSGDGKKETVNVQRPTSDAMPCHVMIKTRGQSPIGMKWKESYVTCQYNTATFFVVVPFFEQSG